MKEEVRTAAETAVTGGGLGTLAGLFRLVVFGQSGGTPAYVSIMAAACVFGAVVLLVVSSMQWNDAPIPLGVQWALVIGLSIVAKDVMAGLRSMGEQFAIDPLALVMRVVDAIRGK